MCAESQIKKLLNNDNDSSQFEKACSVPGTILSSFQ